MVSQILDVLSSGHMPKGQSWQAEFSMIISFPLHLLHSQQHVDAPCNLYSLTVQFKLQTDKGNSIPWIVT